MVVNKAVYFLKLVEKEHKVAMDITLTHDMDEHEVVTSDMAHQPVLDQSDLQLTSHLHSSLIFHLMSMLVRMEGSQVAQLRLDKVVVSQPD